MNNAISFFITLIIVVFASCEKIFEEDIEQRKVVILSPGDSVSIQGQSVTFWWNEIEGATQYELQVVSPNFSNITQLVLDTIVETNKYAFNFNFGEYQCRVRALNGAYSTAYTVHTFFIDSTSNLSGQFINIISPNDSFFTNNTLVNFQWMALSAANDYRFELATPDFNGNVILDINLNQTNFSYTLNEGSYTWRVRGQNNTSNTAYATRVLFVDITPPIVPTLLTPQDNAIINADSVTLTWAGDTNFAFDSVYVYQDSLALVPVVARRATGRNFSFNGSIGEDYFWRVKTIDNASNISQFSVLRKFSFQ